ncbi:hypothetical protein [Paenibacillus sp. 1_12]|uniref:hypothetical protein n=1 Tax=Paenibacillus sp. 1_12 TaxID=1566278 RepID=UPI000B87125F|nr:hypothetical protein [Paenibacillus sp. 1_12]
MLQQSVQRIAGIFGEVVAPAEQLMDQMGTAFYDLLEIHQNKTLLSIQAFTTAEPIIRQRSRKALPIYIRW